MDAMEYEAASGSVSTPSASPLLPMQAGGLMSQTGDVQYPMLPPVGLPPASERIYSQLANFEIEKKIGRGQFSTVFKAHCRINGTTVALKKVQVRIFC
jgi:serine/threonine protein kinase